MTRWPHPKRGFGRFMCHGCRLWAVIHRGAVRLGQVLDHVDGGRAAGEVGEGFGADVWGKGHHGVLARAAAPPGVLVGQPPGVHQLDPVSCHVAVGGVEGALQQLGPHIELDPPQPLALQGGQRAGVVAPEQVDPEQGGAVADGGFGFPHPFKKGFELFKKVHVFPLARAFR